MEKRKELIIPEELMEDNWKSNKVVIRRISFSEKLRINDDAAQIKINNSGANGLVSQEILAVSLLVKAIVEAPWEINKPSVYLEIDNALGEWLFSEVSDFNNVSFKKKEN